MFSAWYTFAGAAGVVAPAATWWVAFVVAVALRIFGSLVLSAVTSFLARPSSVALSTEYSTPVNSISNAASAAMSERPA